MTLMSSERKVRDNTIEAGLYRFGIAAVVIIAAIAVLCLAFPAIPEWFLGTKCYVLSCTGWYCPGCGGTRAVIALFTGHPLWSLYYHPIVLYAAAVFAVFMVTQTLQRLTGGRVRGMRYHDAYLYIAAAILLANWIVKNVFLYMGRPLL